ncbi:MAG: recombinase RecT [Polynucleobacter sp.]|nr:recombinase RecT [Polynucleobacter sp.]
MSNIISFNEMDQMAGAIAASGLFGMKDKNSVLALMAVAQAEGLHPATAARDFHIIQGRPALKADAMLARFQNAGGKVEWEVYSDEKVTGLFSHPNGGSLAVTWTIEQAKRIGLVKPGSGWEKFPRAMLRSRCISEGIRSVFPGSVTGFYSPEEVADFEPAKEMGKVEVISPVVTIKAGNDAIFIENIKDDLGIPMYIPGNDEPYATYLNKEDWLDGYAEMHAKIHESKKFSDEERLAKINQLRDCNANYTKTFDGNTTAKFLSRLQLYRKELQNG